ncbi:hypothetical protein ACWKTZ_20065 [Bacillus cereus]
MKLHIPLHKRVQQFFCKHKNVGWCSSSRGINSKEGYEYVYYECGNCGMSVGEWFEKGEWDKLDFPNEYKLQNTRIPKHKKGRYYNNRRRK